LSEKSLGTAAAGSGMVGGGIGEAEVGGSVGSSALVVACMLALGEASIRDFVSLVELVRLL